MGEEKKLPKKELNSKVAKEVNTAQGQGRLEYDQLEALCSQVTQQNKQLVQKLQEINYANFYKRLDYLFLVVQNADKFEDAFVVNTLAEIQSLITIPTQEESDEEAPEQDKK